jgi:hypothetical protein
VRLSDQGWVVGGRDMGLFFVCIEVGLERIRNSDVYIPASVGPRLPYLRV